MSSSSIVSKLLEFAVTGLLVLIGISVVFGFLLDAPVGITFVETGSMEPTIATGDGFIAIPSALVGVERGDVVAFRPDVVSGGRVTTHRIVGETSNGYLTRGDNNFVTDQDSGEPPVTEGQIVAVALSVDDRVVTIPHLGTAVLGLRGALEWLQAGLGGLLGTSRLGGTTGLSYLLFAAGITLYLAVLLTDTDGGRSTARSTTRSTGIPGWVIIAVAASLVVTAASVGMLLPAGAQTYGIVSGSGESGASHVIERGTDETRQYPVGNGGILPVVVYLDATSPGVTTTPGSVRLDRGEAANLSLTLSAPEESGYYVRSVREYRYPLVLPQSVFDGLFSIHTALPFVVVNGLAASIVGGVGALLGSGSTRIRYRRERRTRP